MNLRAFNRFGIVVPVFLALVVCIQAQEISLTGRVLDPNGAVVPNIAVTTVVGKRKLEARTNEDGIYSIRLIAGVYTLTVNPQIVRMNGFETLVLKGFRISPAYDGKMTLDFSLPIYGDGVICRLTVASDNKRQKHRKRTKPKRNTTNK